tara:strand:- start:38 stop:451 length:414 start_codon:yes stop_codon:yes gene_type:complete
MIKLSNNVSINDNEVDLIAIRAQGSGGQNVNKVSSAIHLRFNIKQSSLPEFYKDRLLNLNDNRISQDGILIIKAQKFRTQEKNKEDAINRMVGLIKQSVKIEKKRKKTRPSKTSQRKRIESKKKHGQNKRLRGKVSI